MAARRDGLHLFEREKITGTPAKKKKRKSSVKPSKKTTKKKAVARKKTGGKKKSNPSKPSQSSRKPAKKKAVKPVRTSHSSGNGLSEQQVRFCRYYAIDFNGKKAAVKAKYSKKSAAVIASQLLTRLNIQLKIRMILNRQDKRIDLSADKVKNEIARVAFSDLTDYLEFGKSGIKLKDSRKLTKNQTAALSEVSETIGKYGTAVKIKVHSKNDGLDMLGRHFNLFSSGNAFEVDFKNLKVVFGGDIDFKGGRNGRKAE